jgi:dipeptide/tripeptide permease
LVIGFVLAAIFRAFTNMSSGKFTPLDDKLSLFSLIFSHIQLLLGFGLYFISPFVKAAMEAGMGEAMKSTVMRFWLVEHLIGMLIGITLITVGRISAKKATEDSAKFKKIAIFFTIGIIVILASIPWPFRAEIARGWF